MGALASAGVQNVSEWQQVLKRLQALMDKNDFELWIKEQVAYSGRENHQVRLSVQNGWVVGLVSERFTEIIATTFREVIGCSVSIGWVVDTDLMTGQQPTPPNITKLEKGQVLPARKDNIHPVATSRFVVGECNQLAYVAAREFSTGGELAKRGLLIIFGPCGSGKTHLAELAYNWFREVNCDNGALLESGNGLVSAFVSACKYREVDNFHFRRAKSNFYVLDDFDYIANGNKVETWNEIVVLLDDIRRRRGRVLITMKEHPTKLVGRFNCRDLASRLLGATALPIGQPDVTVRRKLVESVLSESDLAGRLLPSGDILDLLAARELPMRELKGLCDSLFTQIRLSKKEMGVEDVRVWLEGQVGFRPNDKVPSCANVVAAAARHFHIPEHKVLGRERKKELVVARHVAMWLCDKTATDRTLISIGKVFGKDHTTVRQALGVVSASVELTEQANIIAKKEGWTLK